MQVTFLLLPLALYPLDTLLARVATRPAALGETGTCLWLLVVGVRSASETEATRLGGKPT